MKSLQKAPQSKLGSPSERGLSVMPHVVFATVTMAVLGFGVVGWAGTATLSGAIIAPGQFVLERNVKKVQHNVGGIVAEIAVKNGDSVRAGDVLVKLDATQISAEIGVIRSQRVELHARASRLIAERDNHPAFLFPSELASFGAEGQAAFDAEQRLFAEAKQTRESQKTQLRLRIEQIREEITGLTAQRDAKSGELSLIRKELSEVRQLSDKGLTPITRVYQLEREVQRLWGESGGLMAQIARAGGQISEIEVQILALDENLRTQSQREIRSIDSKLAELAERDIAAMDRLARIEIRAPQSGLVHELAVHTVGGVITPAEQIMLIVPQEDNLTIQAKVAPSDVDQVVMGRPARLILSAFNRQTTPELTGTVVNVAADVTVDVKTGTTYYNTRIEMDDKSRRLVGDLKLVPGMPVEVFLSTGDRTALSYLMKPLSDQMNRAFRE